jgi:hypothetical protein
LHSADRSYLAATSGGSAPFDAAALAEKRPTQIAASRVFSAGNTMALVLDIPLAHTTGQAADSGDIKPKQG